MIQLPADRRGVNFIFDPVGGSGKSLTALYIALNPEFDGADMVNKAMSALRNKDGHITKKPFDGDKRTKPHSNAPEPVQELLIKFLE